MTDLTALAPSGPFQHAGTVGRVRIKVLGPLDVTADGQPLALGGPQQRLVLAILVAHAGSPVGTDQLIDAVWYDELPPERARKTIQVYVATLRRALGGDDAPIQSAAGGYVLRTDDVTIDAHEFETALDAVAATPDDHQATIDRLSEALALWNGRPYADLEGAAALAAETTRLNELRLGALERRLEAVLALGRHRDVLGELDALTADHPFREGFTELQMLALYRSGRQAEALRAFQRTRLTLGEELGIEPSPRLRSLETAILAQDPSLDLAVDAAPVEPGAHRSGTIRGYELREQLGDPGEVTLWRAYQPATGREVTISVFASELANEADFVKRFELEIQSVAQIEHPHLVSIFDYWRDPGGAYVVMPLLRGGTLTDALDRGSWSLAAGLHLLEQVASALSALHRHGVTHGRVGSDAVFLSTDGHAYLVAGGVVDRPPAEGISVGADIGDLARLLTRMIAPGDVTADLAAVLDRADHFERVDDLLRAVRQATGSDIVAAAAGTVEGDVPVRNPYKGLRAFQETDSADFHGRSDLVGRLVESVTDRALTAVVGPSGSGKSSVVKAGLMPAIRGGALGGDWLISEMFPGSFPFEELEAALSKVAVRRPDGLIADLTSDDRGMLRVIKRILPDDDTRLLLVIDQFEELFSLTGDDGTRRLFIESLVTLAADARSQVRVVVTLRADFFDRPLDHPEFGELVRAGLVTVAMPDEDSLAQMISRPARRAGLELEPGLVNEVVRDVMEQPGGLPLMQYALTELAGGSDGRTLTIDDYRRSGGVLGALGQRAEEIYGSLSPGAGAVAERVFLRLVTVDEHADDTRRRIRRTELDALGLDRASVDVVLQQFGAFRLLSFDHDPTTRGPTVEVAHEALIREWQRLGSWIDDQRESLLLERRLREAVADWNSNCRDQGYLLRGGRLAQFETWLDLDRSQVTDDERLLIAESRAAADAETVAERRRVRRLRRLAVGTGVALVAALIAGAVALREQARSSAAAEDAELATLVSRSAAQSAEDPEVSLLLALEAYQRERTAETEQAVLNALGSSALPDRQVRLEPLTDPSSACPETTISADTGVETAFVDDGGTVRLVSRDLDDGTITDHGPSPTPCGRWIFDEQLDRAAIQASDGLQHWFGPSGGPLVEVEFVEPSFLVSASFRQSGRLIYLVPSEDREVLVFRDDRSGDQIGPALGEDPVRGYPLTGQSSLDDSLEAIAFGYEGRPEGDGRTFVIDTETGDEVVVVDTPIPAQAVAFDEVVGRLVMVPFAGPIQFVDLESGEVTSDTLTATTTSRILDLSVRPSGEFMIVSESQVEYLDPATGAVRDVLELRDALEAWILPDGSVLIVAGDGGIETINPIADSLIEQSWDVDPFAHVAFEDGYAASKSGPLTAEVVDLRTGARSTIELVTSAGENFEAIKVYPEPDGLWAFSPDNVMARWEGDTMVEEIDLGGRHVVRTQLGRSIAVLGERSDGARTLHLVSVERGATGVVFEVTLPYSAVELSPSADGGAHVIDENGVLRTYDDTGALIGEIETGVEGIGFIAVDPSTGKVALVDAPETLLIVDPTTGEVQTAPDVGRISTLGFGRDGALLALTAFDGTVRLWDVERGEYAGLVWNGSGQASTSSPSWYDEETGSMWVSSSGKYLAIPLDPERWVERACELVGRDLTEDEWERFVPGDDPPRPACR